jgi:Fe2+ transport system protein FeoA
MKSLLQLSYFESSIIRAIQASEDMRATLLELGIRVGVHVTAKHQSPFGGPVIFTVDTQDIALERSMVEHILVD